MSSIITPKNQPSTPLTQDQINNSWREVTIAPVPFLAELREAVLARSTKRMPKWRFRIAEDFILEVQPQVIVQEDPPRFRLYAVQHEGGATAEMLDRREPLHEKTGDYAIYRFQLYDPYSSDKWSLISRTRGCRGFRKRPDGMDRILSLRDRVVDTLNGPFFERRSPSMMLGHHCLICGKGLTDPASMARYIGPECYGKSTLIVPWTITRDSAFMAEAV